MRIGVGYDIHRFAAGRKLMLGGIQIPHSKGLEGHSDGDALLHAVTDAVLGAAGLGDIGQMFPDNEKRTKGIASSVMLTEALRAAFQKGWQVENVDTVILTEAPKIGPHREMIRLSMARILDVPIEHIGVKAKTMEGLGPIGEKQALAVHSVVLLRKKRKK